MVRTFPPFHSEWKKRTTSGGSLQFPIGLSAKLLFHLTFNQNFRICRNKTRDIREVVWPSGLGRWI